MDDLHQLPRFDGTLSHLYVEHARIDQHDKAIAVQDKDGCTPVPVAALALLMLGPGVSITHAAVKALADNNCLVAWVGEHGVRLYAWGMGGTRSSAALLRQAALASNPSSRLEVVMRMYSKRFGEPINAALKLQQIRGMEGVRVRDAYARASEATGVPWSGRNYNRGKWTSADPVNRALSAGNSCLYGLVHAAILSAGYSPAIGFVHTGKQLSFVYDIADLYKVDLIIPLAFEIAATELGNIERSVRLACRDLFRNNRLMQRVIPDIRTVLCSDSAPENDAAAQLDEDQARPGRLWDPSADGGEGRSVEGGVNYGSDDS